MKRLAMLALFAGLMTVLSINAQQPRPGQGQGGFGGGFGGPGRGLTGVALLSNKSVQTELKISEEQAKQLTEKQREIMEKVTAQAIDETLKPEQKARFKQIERQTMGLAAFNDAAVAKELALTDDQKTKIKSIGEEMAKDMQEMRGAGGRGGAGGADAIQEMLKKVTGLRKEAMEKVVDGLTESQKTKWKEMTGEPFEVKMDFGGFGGRGGNAPMGKGTTPKKDD